MTEARVMTEVDTERTDAIREIESQISTFFMNGRNLLKMAARFVHPDLQPGAFSMLRMLTTSGSSRPSAIAECLDVDRSSVSRMIQNLDDLGLIERTTDPADKRAHMLGLSAYGQERMAALRTGYQSPIRAALEEWNDADLAAFGRLLARFNEPLQPEATKR